MGEIEGGNCPLSDRGGGEETGVLPRKHREEKIDQILRPNMERKGKIRKDILASDDGKI